MSHHPERTDKKCLNCGTMVAGRYCQQCGQENVASHMSFPALVQHFIYDIFHFDGKFFDTLRYLMFKPGFVPAQYVQGKRMRYLDPIRMYLFTSAVFFLFFFALVKIGARVDLGRLVEMSKVERFEAASLYVRQPHTQADTSVQPLKILLDTSYRVIRDFNPDQNSVLDAAYPYRWQQDGVTFAARKAGKDSAITGNKLPGWIDRNIESRWDRYKKKYDDDANAMVGDFFDTLLHRFPYLLFLSLPFFAGILKLLYRRSKQFFYSDHAVFTLYHYVFSFILLLLFFGVRGLEDRSHWRVFSWMGTFLIFFWPAHLFLGLKRFYRQGWRSTILNFVLLNAMGFVVLLLLAAAFFMYSIFTV